MRYFYPYGFIRDTYRGVFQRKKYFPSTVKQRRQILIASLVLLCGGLAALMLILFPSQSEQQEETNTPPVVQVMQVRMQSKHLHVRSRGRVVAYTEIDVVAEVSGKIINISPAFVNGGFFRKGDLLITIDPTDYDLNIAQAQAQVKEASRFLAREEAESNQARDEWEHLGQGDPSPYAQRIPQLEEMRAKLAAAKATLKHAERLKQRTQIRAPFDGRVRNKNVGIGQYVTQDTVLGIIYSSDYAEILLPVNTDDLAFINLPDVEDTSSKHAEKMPQVKLTADYGGKKQDWSGRIVRSEGMIDKDTGMLMLVARISDPFNRTSKLLQSNKAHQSKPTNSAVLPIGLFVEALIQGHTFDQLVLLPTKALFKDNQVAVLDQFDRLSIRTVKVLKRERQQVIIQSGLSAGERVLVSGLLQPMEGMPVTPVLLSESDEAVGDEDS